jgi:hypothetical protein
MHQISACPTHAATSARHAGLGSPRGDHMKILGRERPFRRQDRFSEFGLDRGRSALVPGQADQVIDPVFLAPGRRVIPGGATISSQQNPHLGRASDLLNAAPALGAAATIAVGRKRLKTSKVVSGALRRTAYRAVRHATINRCYAAATHGEGNWQVAIHSAVRTGRPVGRGATRLAQLLTARNRVSGRARPPLSPSAARRLHTPPGMCQLRARPCADLCRPHIRPAASRVPPLTGPQVVCRVCAERETEPARRW